MGSVAVMLVAMIALRSLFVQAMHANSTQNFMENSIDELQDRLFHKFVDKLGNSLSDRALTRLPLNHEHLNDVMLRKPGHLMKPQLAPVVSSFLPPRSSPLLHSTRQHSTSGFSAITAHEGHAARPSLLFHLRQRRMLPLVHAETESVEKAETQATQSLQVGSVIQGLSIGFKVYEDAAAEKPSLGKAIRGSPEGARRALQIYLAVAQAKNLPQWNQDPATDRQMQMYDENNKVPSPRSQLLLAIATCYSVLQSPIEGLEAFEEALRLGFDNWAELKSDPDLECLRGTPKFKEVIEKYKPKVGKVQGKLEAFVNSDDNQDVAKLISGTNWDSDDPTGFMKTIYIGFGICAFIYVFFPDWR